MPVQETIYNLRSRTEPTIRQGTICILECPVEYRGSLVATTSGRCEVTNANREVVKTGNVDVAVPTLPTFTLAAADTSGQSLGSGWRIRWYDFLMPDGKVHEWIPEPAHLVIWNHYSTVTDTDVDGRGRYTNLVINRQLVGGARTWENQRLAASEKVQRRLLADQRRPWLIRQPRNLFEAEIELVYALIFEGLGMGADVMSGKNYSELARLHYAAHEREWAKCAFDYASPESASPENVTRETAEPVVALCYCG